jgi:hypothetical protein
LSWTIAFIAFSWPSPNLVLLFGSPRYPGPMVGPTLPSGGFRARSAGRPLERQATARSRYGLPGVGTDSRPEQWPAFLMASRASACARCARIRGSFDAWNGRDAGSVGASAGVAPAFDSKQAAASFTCWALSAQQLRRLRRADGLPQVPPHVARLSGDKHQALDLARMMARPQSVGSVFGPVSLRPTPLIRGPSPSGAPGGRGVCRVSAGRLC